MAKRRNSDVMHRLWGQVSESGIGDLVQRFRPVSRADFLTDLHERGTAQTLSGGRGAKAAWAHLGQGWLETVDDVAAPSTLPEVVEHRTRERVPPLAPWTTSAAAGIGSVVVVAGDNQTWVEVLGAAGVIALVGTAAAVVWRPRVRRSDRRFRVTGCAALTARADVLAADVARATLDPRALGSADRLVAEVHGGARTLEALHSEGARIELLRDDESLVRPPRNPAEQQLADELVQVRAELLHDVLQLQVLAQQHAARTRSEERMTYREAYGDLATDGDDDLS